MLVLKSPQPPFTKGGLYGESLYNRGHQRSVPLYKTGELYEINSGHPPFVKGDTGGFYVWAQELQ
jgi:hypothetical protein